jgi:hypothetical protein
MICGAYFMRQVRKAAGRFLQAAHQKRKSFIAYAVLPLLLYLPKFTKSLSLKSCYQPLSSCTLHKAPGDILNAPHYCGVSLTTLIKSDWSVNSLIMLRPLARTRSLFASETQHRLAFGCFGVALGHKLKVGLLAPGSPPGTNGPSTVRRKSKQRYYDKLPDCLSIAPSSITLCELSGRNTRLQPG